MNCQENQRKTPKCSCCDDCIQVQNAKAQKSNILQGCRTCQNKGSKNYYKNYAVSDDRFYDRRNVNENGPKQNTCIDPSTLKILANMRQRACRILETSDATESSEQEEFKPFPCDKMSAANAPARRIQNLDYTPQSNFLKKMKQQSEENANPAEGPTMHCGCANCIPDGDRYRPQTMCPCCRCYPVQKRRCERPRARERTAPYSDMSSMHDHCTCFRTWRPNPYEGLFPEYQREILGKEDDICSGEAYIQDRLSSGGDDDEYERRTPRKKKGKSGHVSRLDKRKRRSGRRKSKPTEKDCHSPEIDFSPSLKRPHPNSCERCWRYASPSRSPVNRPSQRFDPNYRRSHSQVNIDSVGKRAGTNCVGFDPETKVYELISSPDRSLNRIKSTDNVQHQSRPSQKNSFKAKDVRRLPIKKEETDPKSKSQKTCVNFAERDKESPRNARPSPMQCSPSMFDKKSRKSSSKKSTSSRPSSDSGKENAKTKQKPLSACQARAPNEYLPPERHRPHSFDRCQNYIRDVKHFPIQPERIRRCRCTKPRPDGVNADVIRDQSRIYHGDRNGFSRLSNNRQNVLPSDRPPEDFVRGAGPFADVCICCSCRALQRSRQRGEVVTDCYCQNVPITLWDRRAVSKEGKNETRGECKNRNEEEKNNPRKYCVFYMNKTKENEKDDIEVLIEELTEGRKGKDLKTECVKSKMKNRSSDSMALRFQKGISEKYNRSENNQVLYF